VFLPGARADAGQGRDAAPAPDVVPADVEVPADGEVLGDAEPLPDVDPLPDAEPLDTGEPPDAGVEIDAGRYGLAVVSPSTAQIVELVPGGQAVLGPAFPGMAWTDDPAWTSPPIGIGLAEGLNAAVTVVYDVASQAEVARPEGRWPDFAIGSGSTAARLATAHPVRSCVAIHQLPQGSVECLPEQGEIRELRWSPAGGDLIAYLLGGVGIDSSTLILRDAASVMVRREMVAAHAFAWAPRGGRIAVINQGMNLCRVQVIDADPLGAGGATTWVTGLLCEGLRVAWSPNGSQLAFATGNGPAQRPTGIYVIDTNSTFPLALANLTPFAPINGVVTDLEWTPDGRYLGWLEVGLLSQVVMRPIDPNARGADYPAPAGSARFAFRP
jgi:hypothetical protein